MAKGYTVQFGCLVTYLVHVTFTLSKTKLHLNECISPSPSSKGGLNLPPFAEEDFFWAQFQIRFPLTNYYPQNDIIVLSDVET